MIFPEVRAKDLKSGDVLACLLIDASQAEPNRNQKMEQDIHVLYNGEGHAAIFYPGNSPELIPDDYDKYFYFKFWRFDRGGKTWIRCVLESPEPIAKSEVDKQRRTAPQSRNASPAKRETPSRSDKEVDWDAIAEGKVRCNVLCAYLACGKEPDYDRVYEHTFFIMNGKEMTKEEQLAGELAEPEDSGPPATEDDVPFRG